MFPARDTTIPVNWKLILSPGHFVLLMPVNQKTKKRDTVLAWVTAPDKHRVLGLLHNRT